ncbi:acyl-CoA thioesterase-1 [Dokdonella immobilis]|uniref:Acyl-CoA thioesterase-1 n=1 Tax=Dokdonella immobilis TaxID=578942 RepID=A0A1I4WUT2_9GAMM|nr:acyl-CoA thioesterase-1 [Dokdonella immobilis]
MFVLLSSVPAQALTSPQPVLVLGDSLSAGYGIEPESGWVNLLRERLGTEDPARDVVNASISGETTAGGLARIEKLLDEHRPALVVLELGANDALRGLPLSAPRQNLTRIIELSRKAGARVVLVGIEIPVNYGPQYRDGLRNLYRDLATEFKLPLVPFLLDGVALDPELMQADGLHPTAAAQPRVLANVLPALEKALKP